jgi:hypothetical protein
MVVSQFPIGCWKCRGFPCGCPAHMYLFEGNGQYKWLHARFFYGTVVSIHSYSRRKVSMNLKVSKGFLQEVIDELI